jgi:uroporphyrinogen decarboxylase
MEIITQKKRLNNALQFKPVDRVPFFEIALWEQTVERWKGEGLPAAAASADLLSGNKYFGLEGYDVVLFNMTFPEPCPEEKKVGEDDRYITFVDGMGRTRVALKEGTVRGMRTSMDSYIDFPLKTREDFQRIKKGYGDNYEDRLPADWQEVLIRLGASTRPSTFLDRYFASFGYYSMLRNWMGTTGVSYMFYDDPDLVHECLQFLTDFITRWMEKPLKCAQFDLYYIHEDLAGKSGPLISPDLFRRFLFPYYRRFVDFLKTCGVKNVIVDTDGNFGPLIPAFLDAGVEGFGPIERAANMNPLELRKLYGRSFFMIGGIDKRVLNMDNKAIQEEVVSVVPNLIEEGGFIPTIDHSVPPDVSLDSFKYYLDVKWNIINGTC